MKMNMIAPAKIKKAENSQRDAIVALLLQEKLPVEDLPASLDNFLVAMVDEKIAGVIGIEFYQDCGLLRSMVVDKEYRNNHIASYLVNRLEEFARNSGITCIYLLTETAPQYFQNKGYNRMPRALVPDVIKTSSEFSHVCPASAVVMKKEIVNP
jgi:amino-acid N-acetyltransferase